MNSIYLPSDKERITCTQRKQFYSKLYIMQSILDMLPLKIELEEISLTKVVFMQEKLNYYGKEAQF